MERVIDGDTIDLVGGERVRFIGMDTPERGEPFYVEAVKFNEDLLLGKKVRLVRDRSERDRSGRILRYVYADDILVNAELVREGYAKTLEVSPNVSNAVCFAALEEEARDQHRGIWALPEGE